MSDIAGKLAVITGGGTGIGLAAAKRLAADGVETVLMGRDLDRLKTEAKGIKGARAIRCDVSDPESVISAFKDAAKDRPVEILVNNAGIAAAMPFVKMDEASWRQILDVNLDGVFRCTRAVASDMMRAPYGRIINISSVAGIRGGAYISHYVASKHAVVGLTRALALEWAKTGITVNAVCPGYVATPIVDRAVANISDKTGRTADEAMAELTRTNPQGRLITVEEVAETIAWLCSPLSQTVNGQAIALDGGGSAL